MGSIGEGRVKHNLPTLFLSRFYYIHETLQCRNLNLNLLSIQFCDHVIVFLSNPSNFRGFYSTFKIFYNLALKNVGFSLYPRKSPGKSLREGNTFAADLVSRYLFFMHFFFIFWRTLIVVDVKNIPYSNPGDEIPQFWNFREK